MNLLILPILLLVGCHCPGLCMHDMQLIFYAIPFMPFLYPWLHTKKHGKHCPKVEKCCDHEPKE